MIACALEAALIAASLLTAGAGVIIAARERSRAVRSDTAGRRALAFATMLAETASRVAQAARESTQAVRAELARAAFTAAPAVDGILVYEERDGALLCVASFGERFTYFTGAIAAPDDDTSLPARALRLRHRVTLANDGLRRLHPRDAAAVAVPLAVDAGRACAIVAASQRELDDDAIGRLVALAEHAAPTYAMALDREHDRRCAEYDGLTGLLTPGAFRRRFAELVERARFGPPAHLALAFADTDRFKDWNDRYGHAAGDALLRELAQVLRTSSSPRDVVARNGGDEFCVVFVETDKATAIERAEALRRRVAAIDFGALRPPGTSDGVRISASIGVAAFPADATSANELLERADAAMYHSKQTGRNGVSYAADGGRFERFTGGRF